MIDVHCHLNFPDFDADIDQVIERARAAGVTAIINTGTSLETSQKAVALAEKYPDLYAIVGIHPTDAHDPLPSDWISFLESLTAHPKVVGIGEIGMDYFRLQDVDEKMKQEEIFRAQLELAVKVKKPIQIHNRQAGGDVMRIVSEYEDLLPRPIGMMHCFAGTLEILEKALVLGFYIGVDGNVTYPGIAKGETVALSDIVARVPLNRLVTETDSPFLTPIPYRGSRNEPAHVILTTDYVAEIKGIRSEELEAQMTRNAHELFTV